jgi:hypothetical protein
MGDVYRDISGSTIVNRATVQGAFNTLADAGNPDGATAMKKLAELVERSQDPQAVELYEAFAGEIQQPVPRKTVLRSIWSSLKTILPILAEATVTGVIEKLVAG